MKPRLLLLAQSLDAATLALFYALVGPTQQLAERNPLVLALMAVGGIQLVALAKVSVALVAIRRWQSLRHGRVLRLAVALAVLSGCIGAGFNTAALLAAAGVRA